MSIHDHLGDFNREVSNFRTAAETTQKDFNLLVTKLVALRQQCRENGQYPTADALRTLLDEAGIEVQDTKRGMGQPVQDTWVFKKGRT